MLNESLETLQDYESKIASSKVDIATAIVAKGGTVNTGDGLMDFAADIATISTGSASYAAPKRKTMSNQKYDSNWSTMTWTGLVSFPSSNIWTDGTDIYYSYTTDQYKLDKSTHTWSAMTWTGLTDFYGSNIWTDGTDIYYSSSTSDQYKLDKSTHTWSAMTWTGLTDFYGTAIWTDGTDIYHSSGTKQYILDKDNTILSVRPYIE